MTRRGASLVELLVVVAIIAFLVGVVAAAVQKVRHAAARADCGNRLRQLAAAAHGYHGRTGRLPPGVRLAPDRLPFASWLTRCLPDLGESAAHAEATADFARTWVVNDGTHRNLGRAMPAFLCPLQGRTTDTADHGVKVAFTTYLGVSGAGLAARNGVLFVEGDVRLADIADGTAHTLLAGERPPGPDPNLGWWYAGTGQANDGSADYVLAVGEHSRSPRTLDCPPGPARFAAAADADPCGVLRFWSRHSGGANFALCDGSVRFLPYSAAALPALATRAGGEPTSSD
jgi:prepilin-type processing-associated H-X9-DG protein